MKTPSLRRTIVALLLLAVGVLAVLDADAGRRRRRGRAIGFFSSGSLRDGAALAAEGEHHYLLYPEHCYRQAPMKEAYPDPSRGANFYGHPQVVRAIERVSRAVRRRHPDAPRIPVGELSNRTGGKIRFHRSHQNGLDVDIFFLVRPLPGAEPGSVGTDPNRIVPVCKDGPWLERVDPRSGQWRVLDDFARDWNWALVSAFAEREDVKVIFIGALTRAALETYAKRHIGAAERTRTMEKLLAVRCRAPRGVGSRGYRDNFCPHADHIHVRFFCPADSPDCRDER